VVISKDDGGKKGVTWVGRRRNAPSPNTHQ